MYAVAIIPLIELLDFFTVQKWYTDDCNAVGSLDNLAAFGCHPTKRHVFTKEHLCKKAQHNFVHDEVQIDDGCRELGSVIGSDKTEKKFVERLLTAEIVATTAGLPSQCFTSKILQFVHFIGSA